MPDFGLLIPGIGEHDPDDVALLRAIGRVEAAWSAALERAGLASRGAGDAVEEAVAALCGGDAEAAETCARMAPASAGGGNPVIPFLDELRPLVQRDHKSAIHHGLTSQDVLDTALVLVVSDAARAISADLQRARVAATALTRQHRDTAALARTLGQAALPTTLGARFATWLQALAEAEQRVTAIGQAPVAFGGAAGTLSQVGDADTDALAVIDSWAEALGLAVPAAPWHVARHPVLTTGTALAESCAAMGKVGSDVLAGARPEVGELREPEAPRRGGSSAMSFKRNPVLSILLRRSAVAAPHLYAQVLSAAGMATDERPDGAWHAEWPAMRDLARHAVIAARTVAELLEGLEVDLDAVARNFADHGRGATDTGRAAAIVDRALARYGAEG